jgi:hypothetical protein
VKKKTISFRFFVFFMLESKSSEIAREPEAKTAPTERIKEVRPITIDREKICPFLLRMFIRESGHHRYVLQSTPIIGTLY